MKCILKESSVTGIAAPCGDAHATLDTVCVRQETTWRWIAPSSWTGQQCAIGGGAIPEWCIDVAAWAAQAAAGNVICWFCMITAALLLAGIANKQKRATCHAQGSVVIEGTWTGIGCQIAISSIGHIAGGTLELGEFTKDAPEAEHIAEYVLHLLKTRY